MSKKWTRNPTGRRLRISSIVSGSTEGRLTTIQDADTGENIDGICKIILTLEVGNQNTAEITYYELNDNGGLIKGLNDNPIKHTTTVQNVEIDDVTAFEIMDNIRSRTYGNNS